MVRSFARQALPLVSAAFVVALIIQVFLAGLGVFDHPSSFITHREFGYTIGWFTLAMLVLALLGREPRRIVGLCVLVLVQFALQSVFVALRADMPTVAALHPLNGMLILVVTLVIARLSWAVRREPATVAGAAATTPAPAPVSSALAPSSAPGAVTTATPPEIG
jgi:hypothetical protein